MYTNLFDRVKQLSKKRNISLREINEKAGLGTNSIYSWKHSTPSIESLIKVAKILDTSLDDLLGLNFVKNKSNEEFHKNNYQVINGKQRRLSRVLNVYPEKSDPFINSLTHSTNKKVQNQSLNKNYQVRIPVINSIIYKNIIFSEENIIDYIDITLKHRPSGMLFMLVNDDSSMMPTIPKKAIVTARQQFYVKNGEVAVAIINHHLVIRRVKIIDDKVVLTCDNNKFDPIILDSKDFGIIGKVLHFDSDIE